MSFCQLEPMQNKIQQELKGIFINSLEHQNMSSKSLETVKNLLHAREVQSDEAILRRDGR